MTTKKPLNEGYQPRPETSGYQPSSNIQKGYQPQPVQAVNISTPPTGGSNVKPPKSN